MEELRGERPSPLSEKNTIQRTLMSKLNSHHIEKWAPPLLLHYMGITPLPSAELRQYEAWHTTEFFDCLPKGRSGHLSTVSPFDFLAPLIDGKGSDNHWYLLLICALWRDGEKTRLWDVVLDTLFGAQVGQSGKGFGKLTYFDHSETHSTTYSEWRWATALSHVLWKERVTGQEWDGLSWTLNVHSYLRAIAAFWSLGTMASPLPKERLNVRREAYDTSVVVPPIGERSTLAHAFQSGLGTLLSHAAGTSEVSKRAGWVGEIVKKCGRFRGYLGGVSDALVLRERSVKTMRELRFLYWARERTLLSYMPGPRLNGLTPCVFWSIQKRDGSFELGFPWEGGRGTATKNVGGNCGFEPGRVWCEGNTGVRLVGEVPEREADLTIVVGREGVTWG